jgi:hypothetical protein
MNLLRQASPKVTTLGPGVATELRSLLGIPASTAAISDRPSESAVQVSARNPHSVTRSVPQQISFDERVFDSLVSLKVAASQYAMHLSSEERARLFARLDDVINIDDWHEEDTLPIPASFVNFLKWMIYSEHFGWSSIGVSDDGNILVAWTIPSLTLTANFFQQNKVSWTASVQSESGRAHSVGTGTLQHFSKQALFYLSGGAAA